MFLSYYMSYIYNLIKLISLIFFITFICSSDSYFGLDYEYSTKVMDCLRRKQFMS